MNALHLDACPWCGSDEHLHVSKCGSLTGDMPDRPYRVVCDHIDHDQVQGPVAYGKQAAITAWNTRISHSLPGDRREDVDYWNEVANRLGHESVCEALEKLDALQAAPHPGDVGMREALEKIDKWCCPVLCTNCADNRETARAALAALTPSPCPGDVGDVR